MPSEQEQLQQRPNYDQNGAFGQQGSHSLEGATAGYT